EVEVLGRAVAVMDEVLGNVEADPAGADDRHVFARLGTAPKDVDIIEDVGTALSLDTRVARPDAGGDDDLVEAGELVGIGFGVEAQDDSGALEHGREPCDEAVELLLARN